MRTRTRFVWSLTLVLSLALLLAPGALSTGSPSSTHASATTWTVAPGGVASSAAARSISPASSPIRGVRPIPHGVSPAAPLVARTPQASGQAVASATTSLLANFNGTSSRDSEFTNFGQEFEPPDQGLCASNGFVVEMVNSAYTVYKPNGTRVTGPFNVNGPFDEGLTEFTSDPRCHYDAATNTWFAVILFISADNTTSRIDLAVNTWRPDQAVDRLPDRHHRRWRQDRAETSRLSVFRRPAAARHRQVQRLYLDERVLDPGSAVQRRPDLRHRQERPDETRVPATQHPGALRPLRQADKQRRKRRRIGPAGAHHGDSKD